MTGWWRLFLGARTANTLVSVSIQPPPTPQPPPLLPAPPAAPHPPRGRWIAVVALIGALVGVTIAGSFALSRFVAAHVGVQGALERRPLAPPVLPTLPPRTPAARETPPSDTALAALSAVLNATPATPGVTIDQTLAHQIVRARDKAALDEEEGIVTEPSTVPEPEPVVAAIVTSHAGVLIARRNDGRPPWTFIAGKIEPGESPADAAIREVKEETGLRIRAGGIIGRRVHPKTGRTMVYMAARPTHGTDVFVGDPEELAEVRWVTPEEADELMSGTMYEPVRDHLRQVLELPR